MDEPATDSALGSLDYFGIFTAELIEYAVSFVRKVELHVRCIALISPLALIVDQVPKGDMATALSQVKISTPERIPNSEAETDLPHATVRPAILAIEV